MKPSELIKQTSPAKLSEARREITGKGYRQEHSTRDKKRLLKQIEEIELIIARLGYQVKTTKMKTEMFKKGDSFRIFISGENRVVTRDAEGNWIADDGRTLGAYDGAGDPMNPIPVLYDGIKVYLVTDKIMDRILKSIG